MLDLTSRRVLTPVSEGFTSPEQFLQSESEEMESEFLEASNPFANDVYSIARIMAMLILGQAQVLAMMMCWIMMGLSQDYVSFSWTAEEAWEELQPKLAHEMAATGLSKEAVELLELMVVPEELRPSVHSGLDHEWFSVKLECQNTELWRSKATALLLRGSQSILKLCGKRLAGARHWCKLRVCDT